jgi:NNP family nitrate/nitrite transporter-like MFS transporter
MAKEPPTSSTRRLRASTSACLFEKDGWAFSLIYIVTFGGFIGLASFLPTYFYDQFKVSKVAGRAADHAGHLDGLGAARGGRLDLRPLGGINTLSGVLLLSAV